MRGDSPDINAPILESPSSAAPNLHRWRLIRLIQIRPRLFFAISLGLAVGLLTPSTWRDITRWLIAWNTSALLYFILTGWLIVHASPASIRYRAKTQDEGRFTILVLTSIAAMTSIGAIVAQLASVKDLTGFIKGLHIGLAMATIVSAWLFIHLMFALHYAHDYFAAKESLDDDPDRLRGGLKFPGTEDPDYYDFLYFSYVIGVASQTADVEITSRGMRRTALVHCILAFFFNSAVLALTINIAAGLM
jgi:uncharacterized membrane protein